MKRRSAWELILKLTNDLPVVTTLNPPIHVIKTTVNLIVMIIILETGMETTAHVESGEKMSIIGEQNVHVIDAYTIEVIPIVMIVDPIVMNPINPIPIILLDNKNIMTTSLELNPTMSAELVGKRVTGQRIVNNERPKIEMDSMQCERMRK